MNLRIEAVFNLFWAVVCRDCNKPTNFELFYLLGLAFALTDDGVPPRYLVGPIPGNFLSFWGVKNEPTHFQKKLGLDVGADVNLF